MTVFVLTVDKGGPKFSPSAESGEGGVRYAIKYKVIADRATLSQFADSLTNPLRGVVLDETGLTGRYTFTLDWMDTRRRTSLLAYLQRISPP
jgi:uncharacterized protein (TIGR03435 family)